MAAAAASAYPFVPYFTKPRGERRRRYSSGGFFSQPPNLQNSSLSSGFSNVLAFFRKDTMSSAEKGVTILPNWRYHRADVDFRSEYRRAYEEFLLLEDMIRKGHIPGKKQATQLMYDLCKQNGSSEAVRVMELMAGTGIYPDRSAYMYLVNHLCKGRNFGYAIQLVEKMEEYGYETTNETYCTLVKGLCKLGENLDKILQFVEKLVKKGVQLDAFTCLSLLEAARKERGVDVAIRMLDAIIATGGTPDIATYNVLLKGLCLEGRTEEAISLFRELPCKGFEPDVISYNTLVWYLSREGRWAKVCELLTEMMKGRRLSPTIVTYNILIDSLFSHGLIDQALGILDVLVQNRRGLKPTATSYNPIISHFCGEDDVERVAKWLNHMMFRSQCSPDKGTYTAISVLCKCGKAREAFLILRGLGLGLGGSDQHDEVSEYAFYRNLISCLCKKGCTYPAAFMLLDEMTRYGGFRPASRTYSALLRGLCLEGFVDAAMEILMLMEEYRCGPDLNNFNSVVHGLCWGVGRTDLSLDVYEMMVAKGLKPDELTYSNILEGLWREDEIGLLSTVLRELWHKKLLSPKTAERLAIQYGVEIAGIREDC